jgi:hypothetical protein
MSKRVLLLFIVLLMGGLIACQSQTPGATPAQPTPLPTVAATATPAVVAPTPVPTATTSAVAEDTPSPVPEGAGPSATPTVAWQIPEIQTDDWIKGGADARLIIVEYGDFQ